MDYIIRFAPLFEKQLSKIKKKDQKLFERLKKKIKGIIKNPEHYKPLRNVLKGTRRVHLNPFIIIFSLKNQTLTFLYIKHHDQAYAK